MSIATYLTYLAAVLIILCTPGPSHLLMLSTSLANGMPRSLATATGDLSANFLQMLAATIGLVSLISGSAALLGVIKWLGVSYLVLLGLWQISAPSTSNDLQQQTKKKTRLLFMQGFMTSAVNPKAVIFFAALFPQFIDANTPTIPQFAILGVTYLVIDGMFLLFYGYSAVYLSKRYGTVLRYHLNQIAGSLLLGAAFLLALKNVEQTDL